MGGMWGVGELVAMSTFLVEFLTPVKLERIKITTLKDVRAQGCHENEAGVGCTLPSAFLLFTEICV